MVNVQQNFSLIRSSAILLSVLASIYFAYQNYFHYENVEVLEEQQEQVAQEPTEQEDDIFNQLVMAADLDTLTANIQLQVARMFLEREKPKEALRFYDRYMLIETPTADLYAEIGTVNWLAKPSAKAVSYFTKSLQIDSLNGGALFGLARATLQIGDKAGAIKLFEKIVASHEGEKIAEAAQSWIKNISELNIEPSKESR
jgi:tetratricopeptide (TPR) repeat protein